jgi:quinol monooxygenase YgiN
VYVVAATWRAKEGEEQAVARILRTLVELTNQEPGCRMFVAHRSREDPRKFLLYERFDDEVAFTAHRESEHFKRLVLGDAVNRLDERFANFYEILD